MIEGSIAQRWARALLQLAQEENQLAPMRGQLASVRAALASDGGKLAVVLESPSFSRAEKAAIVRDVAAAAGAHALVKNFLGLAMDKDRGRYLTPIIDQFNRMADELTGVVKAVLTVAEALPEGADGKIRTALERVTKKKIELEVIIDPGLVGGAVVRLGSLVVDGSLSAQLEGLARSLARHE